MWSRRRFLSTVAAGVAVPAGVRAWPEPQDEIKTALNGPVGLQMWSLREYLPKDLAGTLKKVRAMGFRDVEGAGLWKHTAGELRAALDSAGLRCQSAHVQFDQLRDDAPGAFAEAKALGARWVVCPWIPHDKVFTRDDALKSAEVFNKSATAAEGAGLRFAYHCHGYEMLPSPEGTRFDLDLLVDPALRLLHRALAADHELSPDDLEADGVEAYPCQLGLDHRPRRLAAVVDVHAGREPGLRSARQPTPLAPNVAEQLVHLPAHALEVDQQTAISWHGPSVAARLVFGPVAAQTS